MQKFKLGVIGTGFMANAILQGVLQNKILPANEIIVYDINTLQTDKLQAQGVSVAASAAALANCADYVLLAVKPQNFNAVAAEITNCACSKILSIMAGVPIATIKKAFQKNVKVARAMPNLPLAVSAGMTAIDMAEFSDTEQSFIFTIFQSIGKVLPVHENKLNAVTGISGSGPAYVFLFIKALTDAGVQHGLTDEESKILAVQTVLGGALMVENDLNANIDNMIAAVCSKGGTTIQAIESFKKDNFEDSIHKAVYACVARAEELSKNN